MATYIKGQPLGLEIGLLWVLDDFNFFLRIKEKKKHWNIDIM